MRITLAYVKGGTGKTTSAVYLATGLAEHGKTLLIDTDPQASAYTWVRDQETPFTCIWEGGKYLTHWLNEQSADFDHVVIDTPPGNLDIIKAAIMASDVVIIPMAPTGADLNRAIPTMHMLTEIDAVHPLNIGVLLTRMRYGTNSAKGIRDTLTEAGWPVLDAEIPLMEVYAQGFGIIPSDLGHYSGVIKELLS